MIASARLLAKLDRSNRLSRLLGTTGMNLESLEQRQMLALIGVQLTQLPLEFYNSTGVVNYDAATESLDVSATPTSVFLPTGARVVNAGHGDFQIHARISNTGQLLGGVEGDDLIIRGSSDLDGNGSIDPVTETGDLLLGEITAFGFLETGGPTDQYDYKFVVTGGLLAPMFAGKDIGVVMTSENSTFTGDFSVNFGGKAKGTAGPIAAPLLSSIGGYVYYDKNNDGIFQNAETPIPGTKVTLTGVNDAGQAVNLNTVTLADGSYLFSDLRPGNYELIETQPTAYLDGKDTIGTPGGNTINDQHLDIVLPAGYHGVQNNFGEILASSVAGYVYHDLSNDGIFQNTENPIPGTTVTLTGTDDLGNVINLATITDSNGFYIFENLRPGVYQLDEVQPGAYLDGKDTIGTPGGDTVNDRHFNIMLPAGFDGVQNNFGEVLPPPRLGEIRGVKRLDVTGNGLTGDDTGLGGVRIYIDNNNNGRLDSGEASTLTAADGSYAFTGLNAGSYIIREVVPAGYVRTAPVMSDRYVVALTTGQTVTGIDFANARACDCFSVSNVQYLINGTRLVNDLRGNTNQGDEVTVIFTIPEGQSPYTFTLVSYTAPGRTFVAGDAYLQKIYDLDTGVFGPGTHTLSVVIPDSYYQIDFVCGSAIDVFGPAGSNIFYSAQNRLLSADNDGNNAVVTQASSISGQVYLDRDNDGVVDSNENGLAGVKVILTGTDYLGNSVNITKYTRTDGKYSFGNLRRGTYKVTETTPDYVNDGKETLGTLSGTKPSNDVMAGINLTASTNAANYNFGELNCTGNSVVGGDTANIGFWRTEGQNLIKALNGSSNAKNLGNWLASTLPELFGSDAGSSNNMANKTNTQVAAYFVTKFNASGTRLEAQILATALSVYATKSSLAGGSFAAAYGFTVSSNGLGARMFNVGTAGSLLGVSNNSAVSVLDILKKANGKSSDGSLFSSNAANRTKLYNLFDTVNQLGNI